MDLTLARLARIGEQHRKGIISLEEYKQAALEIIIDDRNDILEAQRNGTLATVYFEEA